MDIVVKWLLMTYLYVQNSVSITHQKSFFLPKTEHRPEGEDFRALGHKGNAFIKPLPSRLRDLCRRGIQQIVRPRSGGWLQGNNSLYTQQSWYTRSHDSTHRACTSSNQTKSQHGEGKVDTKSYPLPKKVSEIDTCGGGRKITFSNVV